MSLAMATPEEAKLQQFLQWLEVNRAELRGCRIKYSHSSKGFGIFSSNHTSDGVPLVVPLDLAITPMRVLQDPLLGPEYSPGTLTNDCGSLSNGESAKVVEHDILQDKVASAASISQGEIVWVEGLVPGIDFCNHDFKAAATWEVDGTGATTGVPFSMYLLSAGENPSPIEKEISISYGGKGNEELLYLYGFVMNDNPDDYLMVHYPVEAIQIIEFSESKAQLLEAQKAELRCLLPRSLLNRGFFPPSDASGEDKDICISSQVCNYSWSGQRKMPSYLHKLVFPADFLNALRTVAMKENELYRVSSLLEELVGSGGERQPTDTEVQAAIWEACGDSGALQLLIDLLNIKKSIVMLPVAKGGNSLYLLHFLHSSRLTFFRLDNRKGYGLWAEQVYIDQPPGYVIAGHEQKVYKLKKALYGLKQAPRAWYSRIESYFLKTGFSKCPYEHSLFVKTGEKGKLLIVCLYVDDLIFTGNCASLFDEFKRSMMNEFEMSDLGLMHYFLGLEVIQSAAGIFLSQKKYVGDLLNRFQMKDCNPTTTPVEFGMKLYKDPEGKKVDSTLFKQIVGSLMYLTATRPDIMFAVSLISRYMENPTEMHLLAAKRILRYLQGTKEFGLFFMKGAECNLVGFTDSDYAGDQDDRRSTSGYAFMLGTAAISWLSKKQPIVTLSSTEAEFVAATTCACQAVWLRRILEELNFKQPAATRVFSDNSSAIKLSKNPVLHGRSKHIDVKFYFLRDLSNDGTIELVHCRSEDQVADIFTKALKVDSFVKLRGLLGVCTSKALN